MRLRTRPRRGHALGRPSRLVLVVLAAVAFAGLATGAGAAGTSPTNTTPPTITGTPQQGATLTASSGSWSGATPITFSYRWQRCTASGGSCDDIDGATRQTYTLAGADVGHAIRVRVTAQNGGGSASAVSDATAAVAAANAPLNTKLPEISGTARDGSTLSATNGTWTGTPPIAYAYRWLRCNTAGAQCDSIAGATRATYAATGADVGHTLRIRVTATNAGGSAQALSTPTAVVASKGQAPASAAAPSVSGSAVQGKTLTASPGRWNGTAPLTFAYAWQRCDSHGNSCSNISGATKQAYTLTQDDVANTVRVSVTATNAAGSGKAASRPTQVIQGPPVALALPTISGTAQVGSTLTAGAGRWRSVTSLSFAYQWTRCDSHGNGCAPIGGSTANSYRLTAADAGHTLLVQVRAQNSIGSTWANSKTTPQVAAAPAPARGTMAVSAVSPPDRLVVDRIKFTPSRIHSRSTPLVARFHVSEVGGKRPVSGALVYAVGVPFGRLSHALEVPTGPDGWATVTFRVQRTLKLRHGAFVVVFVRARKPGDPLLTGVSTRRLVSVTVG